MLNIKMNYNLELDKVITEIKKNKANKVLIQLPDGLKPKAQEIQKQIEKQTNAKVITWLGSCFGACDVPKADVDLLIQWGHSEWR